ncbi:uncharacterized protein LOC115332154 [Ixodes scapularis]|uniref:uncharacterized protein LOC115332154 n=1 Tax=Ixodes scapularis TaxID=6945 RepID=UPI001C38A43E|nr:uncharacterized protein LOC115332154 [Ixodes scapularis]
MGKKCFVPNCNSGYRNCAERVPLFKAPSNDARLEQWRRAIARADRRLLPSHHVCAKHFPDELVSKTYHAELGGRVLLHAPKKAVLSVDAVPSIFPDCPKYLAGYKKPRNPPRKRKHAETSDRKRRQPKTSVAEAPLHSVQSSELAISPSSKPFKRRTNSSGVAPPVIPSVPLTNEGQDPSVTVEAGNSSSGETSSSGATHSSDTKGILCPDQFQIALRRSDEETEGNANDVQGDSDTQESESILPDDGPGWGSSSGNSLTHAATIKTEPPDPTEVQTEDVSTGTACAAPSFALLPLLHPAVQQSSASQGGQHSAPPHSLPALGPLLPLSASRNMAAPEASISSAPAALAVAKRGRPRQYTAVELRERNNAARRAKRLAARAKRQADKLAIVLKSLNARRAKRAAAQRARRQNEAFRKREKEAARESEHLERQEASISSVAATSAVVKPSRPRKYSAEELRERKSALQRARRQAARLPKVVKSPDTRRAERAAAQRARRQKAERLKLQKASMSSVATTSAVAKHVQGDSDIQESGSTLPDDGPGWGSSSDNSLMRAVTIKTEPPEYAEQDEEPSSYLVSVKSEPGCYEEVREPNSLVPTFTKDYADVTKVTFHLNAEPQISEETLRQHNMAVAVKIEPPDPPEVHSKAVSMGTVCTVPSLAVPSLPHPAARQSPASQGGPHGVSPHSLPAPRHLLLLSAPRNMATSEASISAVAATSEIVKRGRGRPRQYTADELRERLNAAKRAKRKAAKSTIVGKSPKTRCKSPNTRRAERAAAQRARRQNEAIRKREREMDRKAKRLKRQKAYISSVAATSAHVKHVQGHSVTQESESILPNDERGWGSSCDSSLTRAVTIKTEPPEYVEQDKEPSSHLVSVKSEPGCYEEVREPNSLVPTFTKDYTDMTKVTFHFNAEPQVSEETRRRHNTAVFVEIEAPDLTEVHTKAISKGSGLDGSSSNTATTAVTIKTEPEYYKEVWEPGNLVPALTNGEPPDHRDVTKVTFHTNPEPQVSKGAQQRNNAAVAIKTEPQDPTGFDAPAIFLGAGPAAAAPKEFQQDLVPTNSIGSYTVMARPLQWVPTSIRDEAQPQANVVYFHNVERHGIAMQPLVATL